MKLTTAFAMLISLGISPAFAGATINVKLWDKGDANPDAKLGMGMHANLGKATMGIDIDKTAVVAGPVTFQVSNGSKETVHEMIVVPVKNADVKLPYVDGESRIDEDAAGHLGEVSELDPGKSGSLTLDLEPGNYAVLCNVPGHFMNGMWKSFEVTAAPVTN
jgi:uncharacterized cupredoxin-like copper-binding protein